MFAGDLAGMTPDMLRQVAELVRAQGAIDRNGERLAAQPRAAAPEQKGMDARLDMIHVSHEERCYGGKICDLLAISGVDDGERTTIIMIPYTACPRCVRTKTHRAAERGSLE